MTSEPTDAPDFKEVMAEHQANKAELWEQIRCAQKRAGSALNAYDTPRADRWLRLLDSLQRTWRTSYPSTDA